MSKSKKPSRKQIAADATRREILLAARRLFAARGYAATSVADIADEAGVSVPTLYVSIGPKKAIVMAMVSFVGEEAGMFDAIGRAEITEDPRELLQIGARLNRNLTERCGDILHALESAAHVEPDVAVAVDRGKSMHRAGAERIARRLHELHALRHGVDEKEAADVITLLTDVDCYDALVRRSGWTFDRAEAWIAASLPRLLLKEP
jgi:AcrR family transcriptional regulator